MRIFLLSILLFVHCLQAQSITAGYDVSFGVVGEIGQAEISYTHDAKSYLIRVHAWTTGMTALLTQNREEEYISQGKIIDGQLRPDVFVKHRQNDHYNKSNIFLFDYDKQEVLSYKAKEELINQTIFDVKQMKNTKVTLTQFSHSKEDFNFFTQNDLLSLFFNTQKELPHMQAGESKQLSAIGSKSENCAIDIEVPEPQKRQTLRESMANCEGPLLTIILHQQIFQSKRGELHVIFDNDGFAKNVLLKDVVLFGDIRGVRTYQKLTSN